MSRTTALRPILIALCPTHLCVIADDSACAQCLADAAAAQGHAESDGVAQTPQSSTAGTEIAACVDRLRTTSKALDAAIEQHRLAVALEQAAHTAKGQAHEQFVRARQALIDAATESS